MRALFSRGYYGVKRVYQNSLFSSCFALIYHRVNDLKYDPQLLAVKADNFYEHIKFIKNNYCLLSIEEFLFFKNNPGKKFPKNSFIITFDDGYADNYYNALPVLRSLKAQALFYICTGRVGLKKELWWDECERVFYEGEFSAPVVIRLNGIESVFNVKSFDDRVSAYKKCYPVLRLGNISDRNQVLSDLALQGNLDLENGRDTHRILNAPEIFNLAGSESAVIGAHTYSHSPLSTLSYSQQYEEINSSKLFLEELINKSVSHFSYPYGTESDYNRDSVRVCRELKFDMVCSNFPGRIFKHTSNFELPRFIIRDWSVKEFAENINRIIHY